MDMLRIHVSSRFKRSFKKIPDLIKKDIESQIEIFLKHPFHQRLKTHKLHGKLDSYYSFYLRDGFRVLFDFISENIVLLINIGSHDDYKKWLK